MPTRSLSLAILADDLTGACDAASPFASQEPIPVFIRPPQGTPASPIWAVDLDVRSSATSDVLNETAFAARTVGPRSRIFVKIDSAGRSPVGAMMDGVAVARPGSVFLISPAFPAQGARLIHGQIILDDPVPGVAGFIDAVQAHGRAAIAIREDVREGGQAFRNKLDQAVRSGASRIVADATDQVSLAVLAGVWLEDRRAVAVGSSGLARAISGPTAWARDRPPWEFTQRRGPIVIVTGSTTRNAWAQLSESLKAFPDAVHLGPDVPKRSARDITRASLLIYSGPRSFDSDDDGAISRTVAEHAAAGVEVAAPSGIVLVGGATARAFLAKVGSERMDVFGEMAPGIAYGLVCGGRLDGIPIVLKSGRFGRSDTLVTVVRFLGRVRQP